jgi:L-methionine (R)-S-oxide reductase
MAEGIDLEPRDRHTLLSLEERLDRLDRAAPQILAAIAGETDVVAVQATLAALLYEVFVQANWCGFYRRVSDIELAVGPYQGTMGCLRIALSRGVCGHAATTQEIQVVDDVETFPGHIACDSRSRSEMVVPIVVSGRTVAVLDVDSPILGAFSEAEAARVSALLESVFDARNL